MFLISFSHIHAQKFELGKVSVAELEEKVHPKDPSAVAAVLFKKGEVTFDYSQGNGFDKVTKVKMRLKIYKKEGYDWATTEVPYYVGSNSKEKISFTDVATYNLVDGKIIKSKLKSDGEFDEKINKYWNRKKITMPNIKEGSIIEFQYTIVSPSIGKFRDWDFQSSIPVNYSEFKTVIPEYFVYKTNQKGFVFPKVTVEKTHRTLNFTNQERTGTSFTKSNTVESKLEYDEIQTTYLAENLPTMNDEAFVNNIDNYTSSITHELSMTKYPNAPFETFSTDWERVTKTIYEGEDFGSELNKTGYFEEDITLLIAGLKTQDEIIAAIFKYVKANVKWNSYNDYYCHDGVKKAYKDKTGNVAEINLMLTAMLRYAGITANPVLLSTRANGIAYFPNRYAFNYVIAAVEIQNGLILLDATEKFSMPNVLPLRDLNWLGRLIRKEGSSTSVDLIPKSLSKEITFMNAIVNTNGSINGKIRNQYTDHSALSFRQKNVGITNDSYLEQLESENNNIETSEYARVNDLDLPMPIIETYSFKDTKSIEIIGDKIYLSPSLFLSTKENPFKQEKREYPVDFGYPIQRKFNINIEIPEGYVVESLPKAMSLVTEDEFGTFKYIIVNEGNKIQVTITKDITAAIVPADSYEVLKDFFQKMIDKQNEKIVLKKA